MPPARTTYLAGSTGRWRIDSITGVTGEGLPDAARIDIVETGRAGEVGGAGCWHARDSLRI